MQPGLKRGFLWTLSGKAALLLGGLVTAALINRALNPAGRGIFAEMQTWVGLFAVLFGFSLDTAIYHFANRERFPVGDGVRLALALGLSIVAAVLAGAAMGGFILGWPEKVSAQAATYLMPLLALLIFTVLGINLVTLGQALGKVRLVALAAVFQAVVNIGLIVPAYAMAALDIRYAIFAALGVQALGTAAVFVALLRHTGISIAGVTPGVVWQFLSAGLKQHVATISTYLYTKVNQLIVFHYCGESQTGLLAAALILAFGIFGVFGALQLALYPRVIHFTDDLEITIHSLRLSFYAGLLLMAPLLLFAGPILRIYGGEPFEEAAWIFRFLVLGAWILSLSSLAAPYFIKRGAFMMMATTAVLLGGASLLMNFLLVPRFQAVGAAVATALTMLLGFLLVLAVVRVLSGSNPLEMFKPRFGRELAQINAWLSR